MIRVLFFGQLRDLLPQDDLEWKTGQVATLGELRNAIAGQGHGWNVLLEGEWLAAVNQTLADDTHPVTDGDEVAFFPPVTGG
jgi:molybdopterin synthase sulfur carrier subunit